MNAKAVIGALVGGVIGALIWGAISAWTGYEIGYVAWGIGVLVGGGAMVLGGEGQTMGAVCALLALGSIFVGKMAAIQFAAPAELRKLVITGLDEEMYNETKSDAETFAKLESESEYPQFMVDFGYSDAESGADVAEEELADFNKYSVPSLNWFIAAQPDFETWQNHNADEFVEVAMAEVSLPEMAKDSLGLFDLIFAGLGLMTAFKLGSGGASTGDD